MTSPYEIRTGAGHFAYAPSLAIAERIAELAVREFGHRIAVVWNSDGRAAYHTTYRVAA